MASALGPLVSAKWLAEHLGDDGLRVIDLRWYLDGRSGRDAYLAGHIAGASFVDFEADITGSAGPGRHPLPSRQQFQGAMRRAGVCSGSGVVVYDDQGGFSAARLWWLLHYFGHPEVAVLDGGIAAWPDRLESGEVSSPTGDFTAGEPDAARVVDRDGVRQAAGSTLIDARAGERYRGEVEPLDAKAGHIPGAANVPWRSNLDAAWRFLPAAQLSERYRMAGVDSTVDVIAYCGSGVSACVDLLALEIAGFQGARLYEGSWSDWSGQDLPVATGEG